MKGIIYLLYNSCASVHHGERLQLWHYEGQFFLKLLCIRQSKKFFDFGIFKLDSCAQERFCII